MDEAIVGISQRALAGTNQDDLYIIPIELADKDEFPISATRRFVRTRGEVYDFGWGLWKRKDGEKVEEMPEMIYVMGHVSTILPPFTEIGHE